jgi:predicted metal-dependent phosphoesterase TrpH
MQQQLGERIIVGEEIMTSAGEIIGLYLTKTVPSGLTPAETTEEIKSQGGIVYIPHPFETHRKGLHPSAMDDLIDQIDIVEVCNGRAMSQHRGRQAVVWAHLNHKLGAASSDAHGSHGLGHTYTELKEVPTRDNLLELLIYATRQAQPPSLRSLLYPKYHRLQRKLRRTK